MRRSPEVPLTLLAAVALATIGCRDEPRRCVDNTSHVVPDSTCAVGRAGGYHYIYGGASGGHFGDAVVGGSESAHGGIFGGFGHGGGEGGGE